MNLNLSADQVLTTAHSVRKRQNFDRPVERSVVDECGLGVLHRDRW